MCSFQHLILRHETEYHALHTALHDRFDRRDKPEKARVDWLRAAEKFRNYHSELDDLMDRCLTEGLANDPMLREFAFCFIQHDPYYFGSGYSMERLLQRVKKLALSDLEKRI